MEEYYILEKCGEGTYGSVFKAIHKQSNTIVALKKVSNVAKEDGVPVEIKYLEKLKDSPNIVDLKHHFYLNPNELFIVMEYIEGDLWKIMSNPQCSLSLGNIKIFIRQILEAVYQSANLLINSDGELRLTDFGLSTSFMTFSDTKYSNNVVSLYYRPPELLLGSCRYGPEIDIWSVGCVLMEMLTNTYLFAGDGEAAQLSLIFSRFGTPSERMWPVDSFPMLSQTLPTLFDLATKMLAMDPKNRISSLDALNHPFFTTSDVDDQLVPSSKTFFASLPIEIPQQQYTLSQTKHRSSIPPSHDRLSFSQLSTVITHAIPAYSSNYY
eukprot:gene16719-19873_t